MAIQMPIQFREMNLSHSLSFPLFLSPASFHLCSPLFFSFAPSRPPDGPRRPSLRPRPSYITAVRHIFELTMRLVERPRACALCKYGVFCLIKAERRDNRTRGPRLDSRVKLPVIGDPRWNGRMGRGRRRRRRERGGGALSTSGRWWCLMVRFAVIYSDSGPLPLFRFRDLGFIGFFRFSERISRSLKVTRSFFFFFMFRISSKILEDCGNWLSDSYCLIKILTQWLCLLFKIIFTVSTILSLLLSIDEDLK